MKIGFLITARLKSSRLKLKLLLSLNGLTVIERVIQRAKSIIECDEIVLCTSNSNQHLSLLTYGTAAGGQARENHIREIRPCGIVEGFAKTWIMEEAKRARKAETPKQPSRHLRSSAPYFYPDPKVSLFVKIGDGLKK